MLYRSQFAKTRRLLLPVVWPVLTWGAVETVLDPGTFSQVVDQDAVVNQSEGATIRRDARIFSSSFLPATFRSLDPQIATVDQSGYVSWVSDGTARILILTGRARQVIRVKVSYVNPGEIVTLDHWVDGSLARYASERMNNMLEGLAPDDSTRNLFVSGTTRNESLFCSDYAQALTALAQKVNGSTDLGLTALTKQHAMGCKHAPFAVGSSAVWVALDGTAHTRTLVAAYHVPGMDIIVYVLNSALPIGITPARLLPSDIGDYLRKVQYGVPVLFIDRDNKANVADLQAFTENAATVVDPRNSDHRPFYSAPGRGTSGKPVLMPVSDSSLALVCTFYYPFFGPSYHGLNWNALIAEADSAASIETGYLPALADLTGFTNFGWDSDASVYFEAVSAVSSITDSLKEAVNALVRGLKSDGLWPKIKSMVLLAGPDDLAGALVPLVGTAPTSVAFASGDHNPVTGLKGSGSTTYLISNRANNADPQNDNHVALYITEGGTQALCGANYLGRHIYDGYPSTGEMWISNNSADQGTLDTDASTEGFLGMSRDNSGDFDLRRNASSQVFISASSSHSSEPIRIFSRGGSDNFNGRIAIYSLGEALDLAALDARFSAYLAAIA